MQCLISVYTVCKCLSAVSYLGLHCLQRSICPSTPILRVITVFNSQHKLLSIVWYTSKSMYVPKLKYANKISLSCQTVKFDTTDIKCFTVIKVHWSRFIRVCYWLQNSLKVDLKSVVSKQKCIAYIEKWPFMVIFLYNLYIFVWIQQGCLAIMGFALNPGNSVIKSFLVYLYLF